MGRRKRKRKALKDGELCNRPKRYKKWSEESMKGAMEAVADGLFCINKAADEFGVPRTTLKDRLSGRIAHGARSGPTPYLSGEEEDELETFLFTCSDIGFPKTRGEVIALARKAVIKKRGTDEGFSGQGWWHRFVERHPKLSLRKGDALAIPRATAITASNIQQYYSLLKATLEKHGIMNCASQIYNMDETGMPLDHKPPEVVSRKGTKKIHCRTSGNKAQITCLPVLMPLVPLFLQWSYLKANASILNGVRGKYLTLFMKCLTKDGQTKSFFSFWMTQLFIKRIPPIRPVMLLVDGHSSHYEPDTIKIAAEAGIVMFCLPPHSTHVAQPLDISFFQPLKVYWSEACHTFMRNNPGRVITKYMFSPLFAEAWYKAIRPANLVTGFVKAGVCLFNSDAIKVLSLPPGVDEGESNGDNEANGTNEKPEDGDRPENSDGPEDRGRLKEANSALQGVQFTPKQTELFQLRYENGYDLYTNTDYVAWMMMNHPEDLPDEFLGESSSTQEHAHPDPFQPFENEFNDHSGTFSRVLDGHSTDSPKQLTNGEAESPQSSLKEMTQPPSTQPVNESSSPSSTSDISDQSFERTAHLSTTQQPSSIITEVPSTPKQLMKTTAASSLLPDKENIAKESSPSSTTGRVLTAITEFLNYPRLTSTPKSRAKKSNGPRVLTNAEAIAMMEEMEKQKKEEQAAKELRKKEREERRQQKEQEKIRKLKRKRKDS